ncbi:MAG: iron ABC transporter permease [Eubacterium sp.]|nr:iron ABC transporter permease [Eubacterium sp.]
MDKRVRQRYALGYIILALLLLILLVWNINAGSVNLSVSDVAKILLSHDNTSVKGHIVWDIRLPRILAAVILGGALAVSGFLLQTFFSNPIAGPFVLGISSGAKMIVALVMIATLSRGILINSAVMILAAFVGSMISMSLILLISQRVSSMSILIICGVMIGYICTAATEFVITFADDSNIVNLHNWSMGSFSGISWENIAVMTVMVILSMVFAFLLSKPMGAYQLGETYARNMGVNIKLLRMELILLSSILSACVTAFAGPISFVGIAVPHLIKSLFKTSKPIVMVPAGFLGGAVFCLLCDLIARCIFAPTELSISSVTAVFGAPVVIWIMLHRDRRR